MKKENDKKIIRCEKGKHYYDANQHESCPWCKKENSEKNQVKPTEKLWNKGKKNDIQKIKRTEPLPDIQLIKTTMDDEPITEVITDEEEKEEAKTQLMEMIENAQQSGTQGADNDDIRTRGYYSTKNGVEPAIGLLLCIEGADFGSTYLLKSGNNYVGRSNAMDVVIMGDDGVSRNKHAIIMYDPKGKQYMALPGEARELYYVNDQVVVAPQIIKYHDVISIGDTKLLFVPICGDDFSWDDYKPNDSNE